MPKTPKVKLPRMYAKVREILVDGKLPAYAWPGGYQMFYVTNENNVLCPDCANKADMGDVIQDYDVNYEDATLLCEDCMKFIDPSYITDDELKQARIDAGYSAQVEEETQLEDVES